LGNLFIDSLITRVATSNIGIFEHSKLMGIIGLPTIKRFNIIIDYPKQKIYLRPNKYYYKLKNN
jgi:hypothetical protein